MKKLKTILTSLVCICSLLLQTPAFSAKAASVPADASMQQIAVEEEDMGLKPIDMSSYLLQEGGFPSVSANPSAVYGDSTAVAAASTAEDQAAEVVLAAMEQLAPTVDISAYKIPDNKIWDVYSRAVNRNPKLFYVKPELARTLDPSGKYASVLYLYYDKTDLAEKLSAYESVVAQALSTINDSMSDLEKTLLLHDWLAEHMSYDYQYKKTNAYNALVEGGGTCHAYTLAFQELLKRAGVPVDYASSDKINHAWNVVKIGNAWFHVDVCWDDGSDWRAKYKYFLLSDAVNGDKDHHNCNDVKTLGEQRCTSTIYDKGAMWEDTKSAMYLQPDHSWIYLRYDDSKVQLCNYKDGTKKTLLSVPGIWSVWDKPGYRWGINACLSKFGDDYYFNNQDTVYRLSASDLTTVTPIYTYQGNDSDLYGVKAMEGTLKLLTSRSPNFSSTDYVKEFTVKNEQIKGTPLPATSKGSITLDTANYVMAPGDLYDIGNVICDSKGQKLSQQKIKALLAQGQLKVCDSRTGSIVELTELSNGNFRVKGRTAGSCYIQYDLGGTHASVKIDVIPGVSKHGTAVRHTSVFTKHVSF